MSKSQVVLTGILALLLVTVLLLAGCAATGTSSASQQADANISNYQVVTGTMDIPMYPDGELTRSNLGKFGPGLGSFHQRTSASTDEVRAYFVRVLNAKDWTLVSDEGDGDHRQLNFIWTNSGHGAPARRILSLSVDNVKKEGSTIYATVIQWPDSNRVPLMEDAENVEMQWAKGLSRGFEDDRLLKVTTFTTASAPNEVEAFYKQIMPEYGWDLAVYAPHGIAFSYSWLDPYGHGVDIWSNIVISSELMADGRIRTVIEASASDLRQ